MVGAVGVLDYQTGWDFSITPLYLIPVTLAAWLAGRWPGLAVAALSGVAWRIADRLSGHEYEVAQSETWNLAMQLVIFVTVALTVSALRERFEAERRAARTDELTGLPNRRAFVESAASEVERIRRYGGALTVACLDLDGFKTVNDRDGHAAGDRLLTRVAEEIRGGLRSTDVVARVGGDEFYLLFPETWAVEADALLSRVWAGLQRFMREAGWSVTSSIGAATFEGPPESVEEMMKLADRLMYAAKKSGGDRVERRVIVSESPVRDWDAARRLAAAEGDIPIADAT
jgi:diguanylate cyclase (GGDEF)-like protein